MTENAPHLPETVAYMADAGIQNVYVIQLIDVNRRSRHLDPTLHFSSEYIEGIKQRCISAAEEKRICLDWWLDEHRAYDFREEEAKILPRESKVRNHHWDERMKLIVPGFCKYAYDRLRIFADGVVGPCGLDADRELTIGNLADQDFDEIWNGPSAQDLRRAHYTWDYPPLCETCRYVDRAPAKPTLPFVDPFLESVGLRPEDVELSIELEQPAHMARLTDAPTIRFRPPHEELDKFVVRFALGGQAEGHRETWELQPIDAPGGLLEAVVPSDLWARLTTNLGFWWTVVGRSADPSLPDARSEVRCIVHHEAIPRIEGSNLEYADEGHLASTYLGGERQAGWKERDALPQRPLLVERINQVRRTRHVANGAKPATPQRATQPVASPSNGGTPSPESYERLVERTRAAVAEVAGSDSTVLVISKGDEDLLQLGACAARHFPRAADGRWAGFHPPDDKWAIEHMEQLRGSGATHLVIPAVSFWWLDTYGDFAKHLQSHYRTVHDDYKTCKIFDLREPAHEPAAKTRRKRGARSGRLRREADALLGYGGQHKQLVRSFYEDREDAFPMFARKGTGCELVDVDGRSFVDWVNGGGPVLLGYRHPAVEKAIRSQLAEGPTLSLMHPVELDVARMLTEMIPCAELVSFGKNGSDAVAAAVRLARAVTGREVILQCGVHGFHDWHVAKFPDVAGVPASLRPLVHPFPYNDLDALAALLELYSGRVAAVVMEPVCVELPEPGYLEGVAELTQRHEALLVFDEMITGFRVANGGAQELYGVTPDLATFGKSIANGLPLSAVVGKREYMQRLPELAYGMTFRGETLSLAAARAVLKTLSEEPVIAHLASIGAQVRHLFEEACSEHGVIAALSGPDARMSFFFSDQRGVSGERLMAAFLRECAREGVLTNGNILPSYAHDSAAVAKTGRAFDSALRKVAALTRSSTKAIEEAMTAGFAACDLVRASDDAAFPNGSLDLIDASEDALDVSGWIITTNRRPADTVEFIGPTGATLAAAKTKRPDLTAAFPSSPRAARAGFEIRLPAERFSVNGNFDCTLRAVSGDHAEFLCHIVARRSPTDDGIPRWREGTLYV